MLHRVARAMRILLLAMGLALLAWVPVSSSCLFYASAPRPLSGFIAYSTGGIFHITVFTATPSGRPEARLTATFDSWISPAPGANLWPYVSSMNPVSGTGFSIVVPLWLLAAIFLAWPATSIIMLLRRQKRGFPVEPASG